VLLKLSAKDLAAKVKVVRSLFAIRPNTAAKVVTPKIGKEIQYNIDMNETDKYDLARAIFKEKVNEIVNDPTALNGYARALGHVEGFVLGMMINIPEVRDYIINHYRKV